MWHLRARLLLPALPDDSLPEACERALLAHVEGCASCRRALRELEFGEALLRRVPATALPLEWNAGSYGRLVSLSRWSEEPLPAPAGQWRLSMLGVASVLVTVALAATVGAWAPYIEPSSGSFDLARSLPNTSYIPAGWSGGG